MKIEKERIELAPLDLHQIRMSGGLMAMKQSKSIPLSTLQIEILNLMQRSMSIEEIVMHFLRHKILISFTALQDLVHILLKEDLILNPSFQRYFNTGDSETKPNFIEKLLSSFKQDELPSVSIQERLRGIPFLRSLDPALLEIFMQNMRVVQTPAGITVCKEGDAQRSLFVLMKGSATVYKKKPNGKKARVASLAEGSVFGEVGFLLGEPRTADVVTDEESLIVRLKYEPELYDSIIEKETARSLQKRFWIIHSLLKSETFKSIPSDCFDALVFTGTIQNFQANSVICRQGDLGESCFIVIQGSLVVSKDGSPIRVLKQGDGFGEIALLNNQGKRTATVQAQSEVWALEIHYQKFYELLSQNLVLACEFEKLASERLQADSVRK